MSDSAISPQKHRINGREMRAADFWRFITNQALRNESERLKSIHEGHSPTLFLAVRDTFLLQDKQVEAVLGVSVSTLHRRRRDGKNLNAVASERLDRIAIVSHLAMQVFEDEPAATNWLSRSNEALGRMAPIMLCGTDIEAKQVRRLLHAMACGGAA
ncbi:putative toxin-antitoxin system antitoxin component (TIGR02293 family) [Halomonas alkaliantarctica]|nr:putative toxin-antitoxin system antitoxin component (TIGR02293 family) [Halomonas alkaliantarctica]